MEGLPGSLCLPQISRKRVRPIQFTLVLFAVFSYTFTYLLWRNTATETLPINSEAIIAQCRALHLTPGPPDDFGSRTQSDRFAEGTKPTLIRNATIWTGLDEGNEVIHGDILIDKGLIKKLGLVDLRSYAGVEVLDAAGAWVSPGLIDLHSHIGVASLPVLNGAADTNSYHGPILPWLASLNGLNTHDDSYRLAVAGGVSTANVLPGSGNAIGGQAFVIKLRPTAERSSSAMLLEPPFSLNGTYIDPFRRPRWRQIKHACGEYPSLAYSGTRMDTQWAFRQAYSTARKLKEKQDHYCAKALSGAWKGLGDFPEDLQWEALVDVLRGRVKVHIHCLEAVDIDAMVRLTNEFKFSIAAFHHAHEAYLVPDLIKKVYGAHVPAVALFATSARFTREAYRGSEFAPRILADNGLDVVMKSDHPVLNTRHLMYEAQRAHYFGLPANLALASVTSTPAKVLGQDHRIGRITEGYDADIVVWDSHPLSLGATPRQVFIDGIAQLDKPYTSVKPKSAQHTPTTPNFDKEIADAIKYEGLPPLEPETAKADVVVFTNVSSIFVKNPTTRRVDEVFKCNAHGVVVVVEKGRIVCYGTYATCQNAVPRLDALHIDLEGGSIFPGLVSFGSSLGLTHIFREASTNDGIVFAPPNMKGPGIMDRTIVKAADETGVTSAVVAPFTGGFYAGAAVRGFVSGLSTVFSTVAAHKLADGAIIQETAALHVMLSLSWSSPSLSTQLAALRGLLLGEGEGDLARRFGDVVAGKIPLVVHAESADVIASLLALKKEVEEVKGSIIRLTLAGATEAHLLAREIGKAGVGVIVMQRPFPTTWEQKRILPGPPLAQSSAITVLVQYNVTVGIMVGDPPCEAQNTRFDMTWAELESNGIFQKATSLELVSTNLEILLGVTSRNSNTDLVATKGGFGFEGKVIAIISSRRGFVHLV
ncbi:Carbohydrate esterase family 9 protein [Mycena sanguinolenta]|uniref:Carbohydrate esterase family 9 protein n=1 Tax=Mycena sanguinolenta TaxID=230812 RepID=A0A8H7CFR0_9AGAR|nr:Carbohydrate esterase family 9 protein [Mycena sanguinolenta]